MHSSSDLVSGYMDQNMVQGSGCVASNNKEIMKQSAILVKLINLLDTPDGSQDTYDELVGRVARRLQTHLCIWELYLKRDEEELSTSRLELEKALESRVMLRVRKEVDDIGDEEYGLKMAVAEWGIENFRARTRELEGSVASMSSLRNQFESECVEDIRALARDDYLKIRELGLGSELSEMIISSISKIAENLK